MHPLTYKLFGSNPSKNHYSLPHFALKYKDLWAHVSNFISPQSGKKKCSKSPSRIKSYHGETSSFLYVIRELNSPCLAMPEKLWVSLVNIRLRAPVVFRANGRSIMHAACRLGAGSSACQFSTAHSRTGVTAVAVPGILTAQPLSIPA